METDGDRFVCYHCEYAARSKRHLIGHMKVHRNRKYIYSCCYCDFRTNSGRLFTTHNRTHSSESAEYEVLHMEDKNVDDNFSRGNTTLIDSETRVLNKSSSRGRRRHPTFRASVSKNVHGCTKCTYESTNVKCLREHLMIKHPEISGNRIRTRCIYCNKTFKSKLGLDDHIVKRHPDFIASVSSKIRECTQCTYKTTYVKCLRDHLMIKHPEISGNRIRTRCIYCNKTFKSKVGLDDHIVKKHPDFIASVSSKIHECTQCTYKTTKSSNIRRHLITNHPEVAGNLPSRCIYCNETFKSKLGLDDHIIKTHPDFIASVSSKIHECTQCTYKTTKSSNIRRHLITNHPEVAGNLLSRCIYCNKTFKLKISLDDHIIKTHPDFIASVSSKIHECTQCTYKTRRSSDIRRHLITNHPEVADNRILSRCIYCNKTFKSKLGLDDHIVKRHPDFIASVSSKILECTQCTYKTTYVKCLRDHLMIKHPEISGNRIRTTCIYCNKTFKSKLGLNDHIVKRHPDFIASVSSKIRECTQCTYKTTYVKCLRDHLMIKHPEISGNRIRTRCIYCKKTFKVKQGLDDHIVKRHPDFIASVSSKIHECTQCTYKTTKSSNIRRHLITNHPEVAGNLPSRCIYCNKTFKSKQALDDHIVKRHPDFIASVSSKIHECTQCTHKTTYVKCLRDHLMIKHPEISGNRILSRCTYCTKTFVNKTSLDDHIIQIHPDFIASVSRKIYECTQCTFKSTRSDHIRDHLITKHPEVPGNRILSRCIYCSKTFKSKPELDDHIIQIHPDFIASVSSKIYECILCTYKTTYVKCLGNHLTIKHPEIFRNRILTRCIHCNKTFKSKPTLDDHILKTHPDFIASVSSKIHKCTQCPYKTTRSPNIRQHLITNHPKVAGNRILSRCIYCNKTFKSKPGLDDHIEKRHPDFIASVSRKVHECTKCSYKTMLRARFNKHMLTHAEAPSDRLNTCMDFNQEFKSRVELDDHIIKMATHSEIAGNNTFLRCMYCNKTFPIKQVLDDHILSEHPNSIASSSKIKEGTKCTDSLNNMVLKHSETICNSQLKTCEHYNADLKSKQTLDAYILREHPYFIGSGNDKINESTKCICKAT
ncbi:unnamed protein product [Callosobruchus maculatus]|nr:unnamed protein product [Callosobruchus maculatus]